MQSRRKTKTWKSLRPLFSPSGKGALFLFHTLHCLSEGSFWVSSPLFSRGGWLQASISHSCNQSKQAGICIPNSSPISQRFIWSFKCPKIGWTWKSLCRFPVKEKIQMNYIVLRCNYFQYWITAYEFTKQIVSWNWKGREKRRKSILRHFKQQQLAVCWQ